MRPARRAVTALDAAPSVLASVLAFALLALLLAACTTGRPAGSGPSAGARRPGAGPAFRRAIGVAGGGRGPVVFFISGPGGPGGALISLPAGGGPAGSNGRPQISVPPIPPAGSAETVALPLDSYEEVSVQEQDALAAAGDLLTQRCMTAAGFSYPVAAEPGGGALNVQSIEDDGYGITSVAQAETYGYKQPARSEPGLPPALLALPGFVGQQAKHGAAWTSALLGFIPGARARAPQHEGCLQASDTDLYGSLSGNPDPDPVPAIAIESAQWTQSDPRILAVQRAWSACMARSGLTYKSPAQAADHNWPSTPTPAEIAAAVADVRCKAETNFVNTWLTVEAAYQQALISLNLTSLSRLQASFDALLRRAEVLLQFPGAGILHVSQGRAGRRNPQFGRLP
jgi:hypothetical protein